VKGRDKPEVDELEMNGRSRYLIDGWLTR